MDEYLNDVIGVVHVGANDGEEMTLYSGKNVLWVEADPDTYKRLQARLCGSTVQLSVNALITDCDGCVYDFHVSNNSGLSSSIYDLYMAKDVAVWAYIEMVGTIELKSITLNTLFQTGAFDIALYDSLVLDTQGSELLVLKGAISILHHFKYIRVEAANFEAYKGCCMLSDIEAFMQQHNYEEIDRFQHAQHPAGGLYYDILYKALES